MAPLPAEENANYKDAKQKHSAKWLTLFVITEALLSHQGNLTLSAPTISRFIFCMGWLILLKIELFMYIKIIDSKNIYILHDIVIIPLSKFCTQKPLKNNISMHLMKSVIILNCGREWYSSDNLILSFHLGSEILVLYIA